MRIIAGRFGGLHLQVPKRDVRPTADRVKESVFSVLGTDLVDARVLDLFAGTGGLGLEALSRGARHARFVERAKGSLAALETNLKRCQVTDQEAEIDPRPVASAIAFLVTTRAQFDVIFADPPYAQAANLLVPVLHHAPRLLTPAGQLVLEHRRQDRSPVLPVGLSLEDSRTYGDTLVWWIRARDPSSAP
ncbi:MAG: 16S rRNA (guanine(966)-N(2))-methyltransferase RsmD [Myxococcota bacterium]